MNKKEIIQTIIKFLNKIDVSFGGLTLSRLDSDSRESLEKLCENLGQGNVNEPLSDVEIEKYLLPCLKSLESYLGRQTESAIELLEKYTRGISYSVIQSSPVKGKDEDPIYYLYCLRECTTFEKKAKEAVNKEITRRERALHPSAIERFKELRILNENFHNGLSSFVRNLCRHYELVPVLKGFLYRKLEKLDSCKSTEDVKAFFFFEPNSFAFEKADLAMLMEKIKKAGTDLVKFMDVYSPELELLLRYSYHYGYFLSVLADPEINAEKSIKILEGFKEKWQKNSAWPLLKKNEGWDIKVLEDFKECWERETTRNSCLETYDSTQMWMIRCLVEQGAKDSLVRILCKKDTVSLKALEEDVRKAKIIEYFVSKNLWDEAVKYACNTVESPEDIQSLLYLRKIFHEKNWLQKCVDIDYAITKYVRPDFQAVMDAHMRLFSVRQRILQENEQILKENEKEPLLSPEEKHEYEIRQLTHIFGTRKQDFIMNIFLYNILCRRHPNTQELQLTWNQLGINEGTISLMVEEIKKYQQKNAELKSKVTQKGDELKALEIEIPTKTNAETMLALSEILKTLRNENDELLNKTKGSANQLTLGFIKEEPEKIVSISESSEKNRDTSKKSQL